MTGTAVVVLAVAALLVVVQVWPRDERGRTVMAYGDPGAGPLVVDLHDGRERGGIFYMPAGAILADVLQAAEVPHRESFAKETLQRPLSFGMRIDIRRSAGVRPEAVTSPMTASTRLALNLPIDINSASAADLILIPGIGSKTAEKIVALREERKRFRNVDELMAVKGIKEKRLEGLRKYLTVE
jgi:competence protein ComEA